MSTTWRLDPHKPHSNVVWYTNPNGAVEIERVDENWIRQVAPNRYETHTKRNVPFSMKTLNQPPND